jgi:hypothetical protein
MKIRPVGAEFNSVGQTDMTKPIVAFRTFANGTKNQEFMLIIAFRTTIQNK